MTAILMNFLAVHVLSSTFFFNGSHDIGDYLLFIFEMSHDMWFSILLCLEILFFPIVF